MRGVAWHSDISYERQPPGTTFMYILDGPSAGGDTIFSNQVEAYNRLSNESKKRLHGLSAYHIGTEQANMSKSAGGVMRREAVDSVHPIVRTHPATGEKALYVNPQFTRRIVGFKKEESDMLLKFLFDHVALSLDVQCRVKWQAGTVVVWDVSCSRSYCARGTLVLILPRTALQLILLLWTGRMGNVVISRGSRRKLRLLMRRRMSRRMLVLQLVIAKLVYEFVKNNKTTGYSRDDIHRS